MRRGIFVALMVLFCSRIVVAWSPIATYSSKLGHSNCSVAQRLDSLKKLNVFPPSSNGSKPHCNKPSFPDLVYEVKIASIGNLSPISFEYNPLVKRYIDLFTQERPEQVSQMLGLAQLYFPLFDEILDKHQLPLELKYLAVVESALNPMAVSVTGAVGLWQFKINSARMFDLEVNSLIDERMDPLKSTEAACMYLKYLHRIFNDWHLVMAAYNVGPGAVRNAIIRSGGETNFWKLQQHLPEAAQNYVPAFIAAAYVMQNATDHGIIPTPPLAIYMQTDTVIVSKPLYFQILSAEIDVPYDLIRLLNPIYKRGMIPPSKDGMTLRLPKEKVQEFLAKESFLYESKPSKSDYHDILANAGSTSNRTKVIHQVTAGEYLHKIAVRYNCTVDDISAWNPDLANELSIGQSITIWVDPLTYQMLQQTSPNFPY